MRAGRATQRPCSMGMVTHGWVRQGASWVWVSHRTTHTRYCPWTWPGWGFQVSHQVSGGFEGFEADRIIPCQRLAADRTSAGAWMCTHTGNDRMRLFGFEFCGYLTTSGIIEWSHLFAVNHMSCFEEIQPSGFLRCVQSTVLSHKRRGSHEKTVEPGNGAFAKLATGPQRQTPRVKHQAILWWGSPPCHPLLPLPSHTQTSQPC